VIFEPPNIVNHQDARVGSCVGRYTEAELAGLCLHGGNHTRGLAPTKQQPYHKRANAISTLRRHRGSSN
jgi:hypothetical protein